MISLVFIITVPAIIALLSRISQIVLLSMLIVTESQQCFVGGGKRRFYPTSFSDG